MDADLDEEMRLDEDFKLNRGVFISYSSAQKDFGEQLCADIGSRGELVVDVVKECGVIVVILSEEYLLSKSLMFELEAIVNYKRGNAYVRIIPAYHGVSSKQCRDSQSRWLKVWKDWAKFDSRIGVQQWYRALGELDQIAGHCLDKNSKVVYRQIIVDNVCDLINDVSKAYKTEVNIRENRSSKVSDSSLVPDWCWIPGKVEYSIVGYAASASFKLVMQCQWLGLDVAIAIYKGEFAKNNLEVEAGILASVQHPNVVKLFGCAYDDEKQEGLSVMELMEQNLRQLIKKKVESRGDGEMPFSPPVATDIILQIVEAMIHVHKCKVLHRDLKPANILVSAKKDLGETHAAETYYVVKLIDFGSAKVLGPDASTCHESKVGTTAYRAPEVHAIPDDCTYSWSADVYSFGMTMYEILTGKPPFEGVRYVELGRRVCAGERPSLPEYVPGRWKKLIEECWDPDPEQRPSFAWVWRKILKELLSFEIKEEIFIILEEFLPCLRFHSRWIAVWQKLAKCDSRIDIQKWCRALTEITSLSGLPACGNSEIIDRQTAVDAICDMAAVMAKNPELVRFIQSQRPTLERISKVQNSMEEFRKRVVICSTQSDYLITKIQRLSSEILDEIPGALILKLRDLQYQECEAAYALLDRFMCNVVAAEDLLYLCAKEDWKLAALSVFLPASCAPCHSKFALVARDLDYTYHMLLSLLEAEAAQNYTLMGSAITDASNQDRSDVLHKLEGELSKGSRHRDIYCSLLMKRLQADASPSTPVSVPGCFWIPEEVEYTKISYMTSGNSKPVLKCKWLGLNVAIALYTGEYAKNDLEAEAGLLASVQHPNVVSMFGCAYDEKKQEGYLVTELMEQDLRQLIKKKVKSRGDGEMPFSESVARDIILQIVEAMIHVHKCRVLHRDLKPSNCVVSAKKRIWQVVWGETYYVLKLIDFGASKVRGPGASTCHTRKQGTTAYMAPEVHAKQEDCAYKWSADVYSFGMTMYEIFTGKSPFQGVRNVELVRRVCAGERPSLPEYVPVFWKQLIEKCWHRDPELRPTFAWIRLEILRGITSAAGDPVSAWQRIVYMPSEIREEFLENSEGFLVNPSLFYKIKSSSIGIWNTFKSRISN